MSPLHIVIAGGGVGALEAAVALRSLGGDRIAPVLVCPQEDFFFRATQVAEPFGAETAMRFSLSDILGELAVPNVVDAIAGVDAEARSATTARGQTLRFDALLLAIGGTPFPAFAHGVTFDRPADPSPFEELLCDVEAGLARSVVFAIPDAAGWTLPAYDLAFLLRAWSRRHAIDVDIKVATAERAPLEVFGTDAAAEVREALGRADVGLVAGSAPIVLSDSLLVAGGHWLTADRIVALPRLAGPRMPGLPCDWEGFTQVEADGAVSGCASIYAVGDGAAHPRKQGGLAAQQADTAARAILRTAGIDAPPAESGSVMRGVLATPEGPLFLESATAWGQAGACSVASYTPLWDPPMKVATRWLGPHLDALVRRRTGAFTA